MRRVLSNHHEVAHFWANQVQAEGRADNMFFEGSHIYSYSRHFCIARILPSGTVVFTLLDSSTSTSRHKSLARRAVSHRDIVYANDPDNSASLNREAAVRNVEAALEAANKPRIRQATIDRCQQEALHCAEQFNAYLAALPEGERAGVAPIDTSNLESVRQQLAEEARRAAEREAERALKRQAELADRLQAWLGGALDYGLHELPIALRISGDVIETTKGAEIPLDDARRLWPVILRTMRGERDYEVGMNLGHYRLTRIRRDGSIVVGCHDIRHAELARIAEQLGLTTQEPVTT